MSSAATITGLSGFRRSSKPRECTITPEALALGRMRSIATNRERSARYIESVGPLVADLRQLGLKYREIADHLNSAGLKTPTGLPFSPVQVSFLLSKSGRRRSV